MSKKNPIKSLKIDDLNINVINNEPNKEIKNNNFITFGEEGVERTYISPDKKIKKEKDEKKIENNNSSPNNSNNNNNIIVYNQNFNINNSADVKNSIIQIQQINNNQNKNDINNDQQESQNPEGNNINIHNIKIKNNFYKNISPKKINNNKNKPTNNLFENPKRQIITNKNKRNNKNKIPFQHNPNKTMENFNIPKKLIDYNNITVNQEIPKKLEKIELPKKPLLLNGLKNLGNTSYINSVLQLFCSIEILSNYFLNQKNINKFQNKDNILSFVLYRLFIHIYSNEKEIYNPDSILEVIGRYNLIFKCNLNHEIDTEKEEKNPNEFIVFLLDKLHNELNTKRYNIINMYNMYNFYFNRDNKYGYKFDLDDPIKSGLNDFKENHESILTNYFTWFSLKTYKCNKCRNNFYSFQNFFTFDLNIKGVSSIYRDLKDIKIKNCIWFYEIEKKRLNFCIKCKKYWHITTITKIYSSPNIFIFLLDFKDTKNINFILEKEINLEKFIEDEKTPKKYVLNGIVFFDVAKKKYNALCTLFKDKNWYLYDDENVSFYGENSDKIIKMFNSKENVEKNLFIINILLYIKKDEE